ncbi:hypothetical protein C8R41DRAFT_818393 [Lentinula lateritia]|uniref:Uncharacterized protein n=1 Tax=Lentinula lateritia TaxID=40482 RepID=A0ABQ8VSG1_9AGAR|nr:hypothetical protein C8R41DRAFT_818393 [Lentinula lateritia]
MTSLRTQAPPVNLKERIAALQQKNADQTQHPTSPPLTTAGSSSSKPQSNVAALREKIAKFEKKGGVPVPRGSFGLGAPPSDSGQAKTSRELYGNRIPAPVKPQNTGGGSIRPQYTGSSLMQQFTGPANSTRSPSPLEGSTRSFSSPSPPLEPLRPIHTGRRATDFSKAMELARKAEIENQQVYDPRWRENSTSPPPSSPPPIIANRRFSFLTEDPPAIIVSPQLDVPAEPDEALSSDLAMLNESVDFSLPDMQDMSVAAVDPSISRDSWHEESSPLIFIPPESASVVTLETEVLQDTSFENQSQVTKIPSSNVLLASVGSEAHEGVHESSCRPEAASSEVSVDPVEPLVLSVESRTSVKEHGNSSEQIKSTSTVTVADLHTEFPTFNSSDDLPVESLSSTSVLETKTKSLDASSATLQQEIEDVGGSHHKLSDPLSTVSTSISPVEDGLPSPPPQWSTENDTTALNTKEARLLPPLSIPSPPPVIRDSFLARNIDDPSPRSSYTDSPGHLTLAHKISPLTSRGVPMFLPGIRSPINVEAEATAQPNAPIAEPRHIEDIVPSAQSDTRIRSDTVTVGRTSNRPAPMSLDVQPSPELEPQRPKTAVPSAWSDTISPPGVEFGTVVVGDPSQRPVPKMAHPRSFSSSHTDSDFNPTFEGSKTNNTFNAVVRGKTRDDPASYSATFPRVNASTPQRRGGRPPTLEDPMSPGFGDLLSLVAQSVILEQKLMNGEYPDESVITNPIHNGATSAPPRPSMGVEERQAKEAEDQERYKDLLRRRPSTKSMKGRGSSDSRRKPSFSLRNPLARSKSANRKEDESDLGLGPAPPRSSKESSAAPNRSKSMYLTSSQPSLSTIPPVPNIPSVASNNNKVYSDDIPPTPPPKSPSAKYLSSFRRFTSTRSQGASQRHSVSMSSEISSEDSVAVLTPPDNSPGFTGAGPLFQTRSRTQSGHRPGSVINVPWPSVSPKKNQGSVSRATSFAGKMFRGRKKSGASTMSSLDSDPSQNMIPELPSVLPPSPSLHDLIMPETSFDSLHPPSTPPQNGGRPSLSTRTSWISTASNDSSMRSPLLDKDFFDSFPSVPQTIPTPHTRSVIAEHSKELSQGSVAFPRQSSSSYYGNKSSTLGRAASTRSTSTLGPHNNHVDLL